MRESFSIWWFAGILLLAYGVVILTTGIWEVSHPLPHPPLALVAAQIDFAKSERNLPNKEIFRFTLALAVTIN